MVALPRRAVLARGLAAGLAGTAALAGAGCTAGTTGTPAAGASPSTPPAPDPLIAELADEVRLLTAYDATGTRHPGLRRRLAAPRSDHARHADALTRELDAAGGSPALPTGAPVRVPDTPTAALAALRAAERAAAAARSAAALAAPAARAGLLASVAASEASHLVVLR